MTWKDVTVELYQEYVALSLKAMDSDDFEQVHNFNLRLVALFNNITIRQVELMRTDELKQKLTELAFLNEEIPEQPTKRIKVNGNYYRFVFDARKVRNIPDLAKFSKAGDVVSIKQFSQDFVNNLHKIAASLIVPQRKICGFYFDKKYNYFEHEKYATDLLDAPITALYGYCLFFCRVFEQQTKTLVDYLVGNSPMMSTENLKRLMDLQKIMDGFSTLKKSQTTKELS